MITTILILVACLALVAISMVQTKAEKKASAKKAAATRARNKTGLEAIGIHHNHIKLGKAVVASGLVSSVFLESFAGSPNVTPFDYIFPRDVHSAAVNSLSGSRRAELFFRGCAINITGSGAGADPFTIPGPGAGVSGKIMLGGAAIHIVGNTKVIKKLTRGLPIRP